MAGRSCGAAVVLLLPRQTIAQTMIAVAIKPPAINALPDMANACEAPAGGPAGNASARGAGAGSAGAGPTGVGA
jgi:hypothetical protein